MKKNKRGIITEYLPWLLIALAVLAIVIILIFTLKEQGISLIDKIKDLLR
jgi:Na+/melibiose symporter-like transporter